MKKILIYILIFVLLLASPACAEKYIVNKEFNVRNGISYGITSEDIQQIELMNGSLPVEGSSRAKMFYPDCALEYTTVLGGNVCEIIYFLDNNILTGFRYMFDNIDEYKTIITSLEEKYGRGHHGELSPFETQKTQISSDVIGLNPQLVTNCWWLIEFSDCCVVIEASSLKMTILSAHYRIDYTIFTREEVEKFLKKADEIYESEQKSLKDGL